MNSLQFKPLLPSFFKPLESPAWHHPATFLEEKIQNLRAKISFLEVTIERKGIALEKYSKIQSLTNAKNDLERSILERNSKEKVSKEKASLLFLIQTTFIPTLQANNDALPFNRATLAKIQEMESEINKLKKEVKDAKEQYFSKIKNLENEKNDTEKKVQEMEKYLTEKQVPACASLAKVRDLLKKNLSRSDYSNLEINPTEFLTNWREDCLNHAKALMEKEKTSACLGTYYPNETTDGLLNSPLVFFCMKNRSQVQMLSQIEKSHQWLSTGDNMLQFEEQAAGQGTSPYLYHLNPIQDTYKMERLQNFLRFYLD